MYMYMYIYMYVHVHVHQVYSGAYMYAYMCTCATGLLRFLDGWEIVKASSVVYVTPFSPNDLYLLYQHACG